ncbi:MAG: hypothetical protein HQ472_05490 [Ignavibacteria bacterium]|nr:hypothetical protein [Ignavibacteria bacterium]
MEIKKQKLDDRNGKPLSKVMSVVGILMMLFGVQLVGVGTLSAQKGKIQMPNFESPPGYTTTVQGVTHTYNFYPLTKTILIPWDRMQMNANGLPKGVTTSNVFTCPSATAKNYYNNPFGTLPKFGTPSKTAFQAFHGGTATGTILYFEYAHVLPADAKEQLSKLFFNSTTPPDPNTSTKVEQFLVNNHTVIVWCFRDKTSQVKQDHQEMIFALISEMAEKNK